MKRFFKTDGIALLLLVLFSLIPLFWYRPGTIGLGHDMGWSLVPIDRFLERFFTWSPTGFGGDYTLFLGSITFYGVEAFFAFLHLSTVWTQKATFIFWFFVMSSSMYLFSRVIYKGKYAQLVALLAGIFYAMNHFTLHDWIIAEFSKWSAMTAFPLLLALLWQAIDKKIRLLTGAFLAAVIFLFFNAGGGSGIPVMGGLLLGAVFLFFFKWLVEKKPFLWLLRVYISLTIPAVLVNAYWIIPIFYVIKFQYASFASGGGPEATLGWTDVVSKNASLLNLFRLQGFSSWYDTTTQPYAFNFLSNPFLVVMSYVFPLLSFLAYFFAKNVKEKSLVVFFSLFALLGILFTAGTHEPFGWFYGLLMTKVYGFAIFRTAFYKFGYSIWFAYAFLFAFSIAGVFAFLRKKILQGIFLGIVVILLGLYNYPFFTGVFFDFDLPFKTMLSLPPYIQDAKDYATTLPSTSRILLVPPPSPTNGESDVYNFGYFSRTPLPFQITQKSIVTNVEVNTPGQEKLTEALYQAILQNDQAKVRSLINLLGITDILVRNDVMTNSEAYRVIPPASFMKALATYAWITAEKQNGQWTFYHVQDAQPIFSALQPNFTPSSQNDSSTNTVNVTTSIPISQMPQNSFPLATNQITAQCQNCNQQAIHIYPIPDKITFLPTSPFYILLQYKENKQLKNSVGNPFVHLGFALFYSERHALELQTLAAQLKISKETLDQHQRLVILQKYQALLNDVKGSYAQLSPEDQIRTSNDVVSSLQRQRRILKTLVANSLFEDFEDMYYNMYDAINTTLDNKTLRNSYAFNQSNYLYTLHLDESGIYNVQTNQDIANVAIDGAPIKTSTVSLSAGNHDVVINNIQKNSQLDDSSIVLNGDSPEKDIALPDIEKNQSYAISFDASSTQVGNTLEYEVKDDLGSIKTSGLVPISANVIKHVSLNFIAGAAVNGAYTFSLHGDSEEGNPAITVTNMRMQKKLQPTFAVSFATASAGTTNILPIISSKQINPTTYQISVTNASDPFALIFRETFSPLWKAKFSDGTVLTSHGAFYDSFNGWYVTKKGNYTITVSFAAQKTYYIAVIVSILTLISTGVLAFITRKK